jgi:mannose-1-phosphate guanylyltransferase
MPPKPDIRAVIMAGGSGTRFWPLSRRRRAKQFLPIVSDRTMFEETVRRILPLVPVGRIYTVANAAQTRTIRRLLPGLPAAQYIVEPEARNTAPSLILATARIYLDNPKAVVAVLASDHLITAGRVFLRKLAAAAEAAAAEDALITFGIPPSFPSTGYGYIRYRKSAVRTFRGETFREVEAFVEKPSSKKAAAFLRAGGYAWNSGMFLWRADVFAGKLERFAPDFFEAWTRVLAALRSKSRTRIAAAFSSIPAISIDYALMEKARGVLAAEGDFGWSDVGAWSSLAGIWPRDPAGNSFKGASVVIDSRNNLAHNPGRLTALVGVDDLVIVNTPDALLVCRRDQDQSVKRILELLAERGDSEFL